MGIDTVLPCAFNATSVNSFNSAIGTGGNSTLKSSLSSTPSKLKMNLRPRMLQLMTLKKTSRRKQNCAKITNQSVSDFFLKRIILLFNFKRNKKIWQTLKKETNNWSKLSNLLRLKLLN